MNTLNPIWPKSVTLVKKFDLTFIAINECYLDG